MGREGKKLTYSATEKSPRLCEASEGMPHTRPLEILRRRAKNPEQILPSAPHQTSHALTKAKRSRQEAREAASANKTPSKSLPASGGWRPTSTAFVGGQAIDEPLLWLS